METKSQKILFYALYALVALLVIFSLFAIRNRGEDGYQRCIQRECELDSVSCQKLREISNCCQGAGGEVAAVNNKYICQFS